MLVIEGSGAERANQPKVGVAGHYYEGRLAMRIKMPRNLPDDGRCWRRSQRWSSGEFEPNLENHRSGTKAGNERISDHVCSFLTADNKAFRSSRRNWQITVTARVPTETEPILEAFHSLPRSGAE